MYYLFDKTGVCATIGPDEDKLKELIAEDDKESLILEDDRWLNPSDLSVVDGKIKIATIAEPTAEEIKQKEIEALNTEYDSQFAALATSLGLATLSGDQTVIDGIKSDYTELKAEYQTKLEAINNG